MDYGRPDRISDWISKWENHFGSVAKNGPVSKTLIYLALLERQEDGKWSSYEDIAEELKVRGIIEGNTEEISLSLRNGMHQVVKALKQDELYEIEKSKDKRQALFRLRKRLTSSTKTAAPNEIDIVTILDPDPSASMTYVAERLVRDRRMPFYGIYLPMRAASTWVLYSEEEARQRRNYEVEQCERLLAEWLAKYRGQEISVVGLGVGEGIGEIGLLEKLLGENYGFKKIHYCAIDTNIHLLMDHAERLRDKFKNEITDKKLVCGIIRGNFLQNFSNLIQNLRAVFKEKDQFNYLSQGFLPNGSGTLVSILGNLVGNLEHRASEWTYFQPILEGLKGRDLALLLGVSVQRKDDDHKTVIQEQYTRDLDKLLLETPRYLTHELRILKSHQPETGNESNKAREFFLPEHDEHEKLKRCPSVQVEEYQGDYSVQAENGKVEKKHIRGDIYEFFYITEWDLSMEIGGEMLTVPEHTALLLYNIIKFDLDTLIAFLKSRGLEEPHPDSVKEYRVGERAYAVLAVIPKSYSEQRQVTL